MVELIDLNKKYQNGIHAVKNINLKIEKNDIFGIIGFSGAGKSSLIRMINRLEEPSSGTILIDGKDITKLNKNELKEERKKIGMIFQHFNLLDSKTVEQNIAFSLEICKWEKNKIKERVKELLALVSLEDKAKMYPSQLSGGQKQRVAIARALANNPSILLSDEATSALDPKTTKDILKLLKDINQKLGITIIMITHQMEVVKEICNKVAIMSAGEIVECGGVHHIFSRPSHAISKELLDENTGELELVKSLKKDGRYIIKTNFIGSTASEAIISKIIKDFDIEISILSGTIDNLTTMRVGHLYLELIGDLEKQKQAIKMLQDSDVIVEVIYDAN